MKNEPLSGRSMPETGNAKTEYKAYYHLPGLFEFYELYKVFLPLYREHREYFYDWCDIGSVYGAPGDCLWGGGRVGYGDSDVGDVLELMSDYGISARLTFSNSLLRPEHLADKRCNDLCRAFENGGAAANDTQSSGRDMPILNQVGNKTDVPNGVIVHSELLLDYLRENYPGLYMVSSTTKVITDFDQFSAELDRDEFRYVVPDFRLNKAFDRLGALSQKQKDKVEFLCNECCSFSCQDRKACYEDVSRMALGEKSIHRCTSPNAAGGYRFSKAMENPGFIGIDDIKNIYLPLGFSNFKIEGRSLGSAIVLEFLLYYMTKPEYQLRVREEIYLDNTLDLF